MTTYELLAADRSVAIQRQAAERAARAAHLGNDIASDHHTARSSGSAVRRLRVRFGIALMAAGTSIAGTGDEVAPSSTVSRPA